MIEYFLNQPTLFIIYIGVVGLLVGSFLNVVILRLPVMMERDWRQQCTEMLEDTDTAPDKPQEEPAPFNLVTPRSRCPHCNHLIGAFENIPVISYLLQRGRCKSCKASISCRYPIIEVTTALLSAVVAWQFGVSWETLAALILTWTLICLSVIDFDHQLLPDNITLPFLWLGLGISLFDVFIDSHSAILGALVGYLSLWSIYQLFKIITGKEGMGYGDFKLLALLGAWLGWKMILPIVLLSSLVGAIIGIGLIMVLGRERNIPIPFGPYLATAGWITLLWGNDIVHLYLTSLS